MAESRVARLRVADLRGVDVTQAFLAADVESQVNRLDGSLVLIGHLITRQKTGNVPGDIRADTGQEVRHGSQFIGRVVQSRNHERRDLEPDALVVKKRDGFQDAFEPATDDLAVGYGIETLQINVDGVEARGDDIHSFRGHETVGHPAVDESLFMSQAGDLERIFEKDGWLGPGCRNTLASVTLGCPDHFLGLDPIARRLGARILAQPLGTVGILAKLTHEIASDSTERHGRRSGQNVTERLLLDWGGFVVLASAVVQRLKLTGFVAPHSTDSHFTFWNFAPVMAKVANNGVAAINVVEENGFSYHILLCASAIERFARQPLQADGRAGYAALCRRQYQGLGSGDDNCLLIVSGERAVGGADGPAVF